MIVHPSYFPICLSIHCLWGHLPTCTCHPHPSLSLCFFLSPTSAHPSPSPLSFSFKVPECAFCAGHEISKKTLTRHLPEAGLGVQCSQRLLLSWLCRGVPRGLREKLVGVQMGERGRAKECELLPILSTAPSGTLGLYTSSGSGLSCRTILALSPQGTQGDRCILTRLDCACNNF